MFRRILIHAIIIGDDKGRFFTQLIRNNILDESLLAGFIAALNMFGEETLGNIEDITINGLNINLLVVSKYDLICVVIMDSDLPKLDFKKKCLEVLDAFNNQYQSQIKDWMGDVRIFKPFTTYLDDVVQYYFLKLKENRKQSKIKMEEIPQEPKEPQVPKRVRKSQRGQKARIPVQNEFVDKNQDFSSVQIIKALERDLEMYQTINVSLEDQIGKYEAELKILREKLKEYEDLF